MSEFNNNNATEEVVHDEAAAAKDVQDNKLMAILSYVGLLWLVPLLTKSHEKSPFVKFHLNQGILVLAMWVAYGIVHAVLGVFRRPVVVQIQTVLGSVSTHTGAYVRPLWVTLITTALSVFVLVIAILGIVNAAKGEQKKLPLIGDLYTVFK